MKIFIVFVFLINLIMMIQIVRSQVFDPHTIYSNNMTSSIIYFKPKLCNCPSVCQTNNNSIPELQTFKFTTWYKFNNISAIIFKMVVTRCNPIIINTDHFNDISYSFDNISWTKTIGYAFVCPMMGEIYIRIEQKIKLIPKLLRWSAIQTGFCNTTTMTNYVISEKASYNFSAIRYFGIVIISNCELKNTLSLSHSNISQINYNIDTAFALEFTTNTDIINISLDIEPKLGYTNCSINLYTTNLTLQDIFTANVLFVNSSNTNIDELIVLQETASYNINHTENITINGYLSCRPSMFEISNMKNSDVYSLLANNIINITDYFDSLLDYYQNIDSKTINIDEIFIIPIGNIVNLNNSFITINISQVPLGINIENSILIISKPVTIESLNISGNNTWILNETSGSNILINDTATLSGNLIVFGLNNYTQNYTLLQYKNVSQKFDNITIQNISDCIQTTPDYQQYKLVILFSVLPECQSIYNNSSNINESLSTEQLLYYIILPLLFFLIIVAVVVSIVLLKVKYFRKKVFPHKDKAYFVPTLKLKRNIDSYMPQIPQMPQMPQMPANQNIHQ